ncbi:MAG: sulfite exporter TauE/SafE family protein [Spirochaetaceae bacterium]|nr:sulfite exporter TauE/SafE family protein [Spirochaetaceae bacterium]
MSSLLAFCPLSRFYPWLLYRAGIRFDRKRTVFIALGSIFGGLAGKSLFSSMVTGIKQTLFVTAFQSLILAVLLILVLVYLARKNIQNHDIHNRVIILTAGFLLGLTAAFLGVGGGPFNVVLLSLLFSMDTKSASVHSLLIIFFSQSAKLIAILSDTGFSEYNLSALVFMIPGGILGGVIGTGLNRKLEGETIQLLFKIIVSAIILLNLFNLIKCIDAL